MKFNPWTHQVKSTTRTQSVGIADHEAYIEQESSDGTVLVIVRDLDEMPAGPYALHRDDLVPLGKEQS